MDAEEQWIDIDKHPLYWAVIQQQFEIVKDLLKNRLKLDTEPSALQESYTRLYSGYGRLH